MRRIVVLGAVVLAGIVAVPAAAARYPHHHHAHHEPRHYIATYRSATSRHRRRARPRHSAPAPVIPSFLTAGAPTQTFTVTDPQVIPTAGELTGIERAVTRQTFALRHYWNTPVATWGPGGIPVTLTTGAPPLCTFPGSQGCHGNGPLTDGPDGPWIALNDADATLSMYLSHEIDETLVDPATTGIEVCDPVEDSGYQIGTYVVTDFVIPGGGDFLTANHIPSAVGV